MKESVQEIYHEIKSNTHILTKEMWTTGQATVVTAYGK